MKAQRTPVTLTLGLLLSSVVAGAQPTVLETLLSSYLGGSGPDSAFAIAFDRFDNMWICGDLIEEGFVFPSGVTPTPLPGRGDIFVVHIVVDEDNEGKRAYSLVQTLIIGGSDFDSCGGIVITQDDRIFIAGRTQSQDFPALKTQLAGDSDFFTAELGPEAAALQPGGGTQGLSQLGPRRVINAASYGGPGGQEFRDLKLRVNEQGVELYLGGNTIGGMPLGPGRPAHTGAGLRDMVILRINDDLDLLAGVGMGGAADEFFGDLSVEDGQGRFVGSTGSPRFEGLNNPGTGQTAVSGTFDLDSLATTARLHPTPDGNDQFILQRHAQAAARRTPDNEQDVLPPALLGYGTASDAQLRPTSIVMDLDTNAIYSSEDNTTARVLLADAAGGAHYAFLGPMHGFGVCSQEAGGRVTCIRNEALPDPGASLFMNGIGKNTSGQIAFVGSAGNTVNPTPGAVQAGFGGVRDGFVIDTLQPFLLGLANAAFHGDLGPGDLATAFGAKIGPRKDSYAASPIVNNALQMEVEGVEVLIQREDDSQITAPLLNASYGQTAFELPTSLRPGERIGVQVRGGNLVSNMYWLTLREPGISPFLFNDNEAVVQNGATSAIVTESNPLKPGEFAVLWANSGIPRTPACAGPGSVADPTGNPLHRLVNPEARTVRLQAVTAARETLFDDRAAFEGSPPGQLCNSVLQVNFALADAARWSEASVQAALTASAALRNSDPARFREILAQDPWLPILDPVTGAVLPVFVLLD